MTAYYNEFDPYAAQWLRNLIQAGHIAPGYVDERSILDVTPADLAGYTQRHFFAGIGVWSHALRGAGWSDETPVWTGSCPCQPFSSAGAKAAFTDERHLWPHFQWLIEQCAPAVVIGEQVASKDAEPWLDLVQADMEAMGYAFGAVAFPAASVGAPHIRDRLYWVGHSGSERLEGHAGHGGATGWERPAGSITTPSVSGGLADTGGERVRAEGFGALGATAQGMCGTDGQRERIRIDAGAGSAAKSIGLADACNQRRQQDAGGAPSHEKAHGAAGRNEQQSNGDHLSAGDVQAYRDGATGPTNGFWADADWLLCRDGKWRPVEPGTFPLVTRPPSSMGRMQPGLSKLYGRNRTGRLRGYGNAICATQAQIFIEAVKEALTP